MDLADTYEPEFESPKRLLLELPQLRSVDRLLNVVVAFLAKRPHVALARIWLLDKADSCPSCAMRSVCPGQGPCLHLRASAGRSALASKTDWSGLQGEFRRIPIGHGKVGRIASAGEEVVIGDGDQDCHWATKPEWVRSEGIRGFNGQPIIHRGDILGVVGVFTRISTPEQGPIWLRIFADHIASAIVNARAFEEIERLTKQLKLENTYLQEEVVEAKGHGDIVGTSPALRQMLRRVEMVASTDASVLLLGESGTGKELVAREIHRRSRLSQRPLIRVNCASVPRELFESEFFGHVRGAFTGAVKDRSGRFAAADGGTLFLDEVGEIPLELQSKFLRVLQEQQYERVGEEKTRTVKVRIIAATNCDLKKEVETHRFRQDLYYRLNVFPIEAPPLRDRQEDIPALAAHFLKHTAKRMNLPTPRLSQAHLVQLQSYHWPGNVRELQNIVERAVILSRQGQLSFDLPYPGDGVKPLPKPVVARSEAPSQVLTEVELRQRERDNTELALRQAAWRIHGPGGAAELLGVKPTTLVARIKKMGLKKPS